MNKTTSACFQDIYKENLSLLEMAREERWDEFTEQAERYVIMIHDVFGMEIDELDSEGKRSLLKIMQDIQDNEKEMTDKLKQRLSFLRENMSRLHHGNKCSQLYSNQFISAKQNYR